MPRTDAILPPGELRLAKAIYRLTRLHGVPPSYRDLMRAAGSKSPNSVTRQVAALREKGFVRAAVPNGMRGLSAAVSSVTLEGTRMEDNGHGMTLVIDAGSPEGKRLLLALCG